MFISNSRTLTLISTANKFILKDIIHSFVRKKSSFIYVTSLLKFCLRWIRKYFIRFKIPVYFKKIAVTKRKLVWHKSFYHTHGSSSKSHFFVIKYWPTKKNLTCLIMLRLSNFFKTQLKNFFILQIFNFHRLFFVFHFIFVVLII